MPFGAHGAIGRLARCGRYASALVVAAMTAHPARLAGQHGDTTKTFFTRRDAVLTAEALAGTAVLTRFDTKIARWWISPGIQGSPSRSRVVGDLTHVNETTLTAAAILSYGIGRLVHSPTFADVSLHTAESVVLTSVISQVIRGPLGRTRPSVDITDPYHFQFGKGFTHFDNRSFPSLHSATAFAAASALVGEIGERDPGATWFAAPVLYTAAAIPGLTRMYLNQHWASDIAAGAFVGTLLGNRVVHYAHSHHRSKLDRILLGAAVLPDGHGGGLAVATLRP